MVFSYLTGKTIGSKKHRGGRGGQSVQYFTVHHCASTSNGNDQYLATGNNDVSANYCLRNDNILVGIVPEELAAWTTGPTVDNKSVTVETVNSSGAPNWNVSAAQKETLAKLFLDLSERYGWGRPSRSRIKGHREWGQQTACPGPDLLGSLNDIANRAAQLWDEKRGGGSTPAPSGDTYTVVKGDTLSGIGGKTGKKWQDIAAVNGIGAPYTIHPGQKLKLPGSGGGAPSTGIVGKTISLTDDWYNYSTAAGAKNTDKSKRGATIKGDYQIIKIVDGVPALGRNGVVTGWVHPSVLSSGYNIR